MYVIQHRRDALPLHSYVRWSTSDYQRLYKLYSNNYQHTKGKVYFSVHESRTLHPYLKSLHSQPPTHPPSIPPQRCQGFIFPLARLHLILKSIAVSTQLHHSFIGLSMEQLWAPTATVAKGLGSQLEHRVATSLYL